MAQNVTVKLVNGPLAGDLMRCADLDPGGMPPSRVHAPVPVLHEDRETFEWRAGVYFLHIAQPRRDPDEPYSYLFHSLLPARFPQR